MKTSGPKSLHIQMFELINTNWNSPNNTYKFLFWWDASRATKGSFDIYMSYYQCVINVLKMNEFSVQNIFFNILYR